MTTFKITIAEPCHENWKNMVTTSCGAFCHSCQKEVIDYTGKTSVEIAQIFGNNKGATCGKFMPSQLAHVYEYMHDKPVRNYWFNKGLIGTGLSILVATTHVRSESKNKIYAPEITLAEYAKKAYPTVENKFDEGYFIINGSIVDESGEPVAFATVVTKNISGEIIGVITDIDGNFTLKIPRNKLNDLPQVILTFKNVGYKTQDYTIDIKGTNTICKIVLKSEELPIIGMIITVKKPTPLTKKPETPIEHELWYDYKFNGGE